MTFEEEAGLNAGLHGLKIGKFLKKNIKSASKDISIKNIGKVVKVAAPIATSLLPVGGGLVNKVLTSKAGAKVAKIANSNAVKKIKNVVNTGKKLKSTLVKPKASFNYMGQTSKPVATTVAKQSEPVSVNEFEEPINDLQEIEKIDSITPIQSVTPLPTQPKDNTILYIGGGLVLATAIYFATKKSNKN